MTAAEPLGGRVVVDLSRHLPGPLTARMLANLGARVIKVERPPHGDPVRAAPGLADLLLGGVESVALDLGEERGRRVLAALLTRADVLLESFRPGRLSAFGFGPDELAGRWPRLVVCSISGWGATGPRAADAGHDLTYQAAAGAVAASMPNAPAADLLGAFAAVAAIAAALARTAATGRGCVIDASLYDAARLAAVVQSSVPPLSGVFPCYRIYSTSDGRRFALAVLEEGFWRAFCRAARRPDLEPLQYRPDAASHAAVADLFARRTADEWQELCRRHDVPGETVRGVDEARADGQASARGLELAAGLLPFPALLDGRRPAAPGAVPEVGRDTAAVLLELGLDPHPRG